MRFIWENGWVTGRQGTFPLHACKCTFLITCAARFPSACKCTGERVETSRAFDDVFHALFDVRDPALKGQSTKRPECVVCNAYHRMHRTKKRPMCVTACEHCDVPLHIGYCNKLFHSVRKWWEEIEPGRIWLCRGDSMTETKQTIKKKKSAPASIKHRLLSVENFAGPKGMNRKVRER